METTPTGATPTKMRIMYEHGYGVARIMELTGRPYIEVLTKLKDAGTTMITGGPHDTEKCGHDHTAELAELHRLDACDPCKIKARKRTAAERRALGLVAA